MNWEGAELCYYLDGESYSLSLSDAQFAMVSKILGLSSNLDGTVSCFSDATLMKLANLKSNPLHLEQIGDKNE